jgi:hypothetical protein
MPKKKICPKCGANLQVKALVDSDDRIQQSWRFCESIGCGYDENTDEEAYWASKSVSARMP